jgi:hypothetical protein
MSRYLDNNDCCVECLKDDRIVMAEISSWDYGPMCSYHADMVEITPSMAFASDKNGGWNPDQDQYG